MEKKPPPTVAVAHLRQLLAAAEARGETHVSLGALAALGAAAVNPPSPPTQPHGRPHARPHPSPGARRAASSGAGQPSPQSSDDPGPAAGSIPVSPVPPKSGGVASTLAAVAPGTSGPPVHGAALRLFPPSGSAAGGYQVALVTPSSAPFHPSMALRADFGGAACPCAFISERLVIATVPQFGQVEEFVLLYVLEREKKKKKKKKLILFQHPPPHSARTHRLPWRGGSV
jgi:hypothetical protein